MTESSSPRGSGAHDAVPQQDLEPQTPPQPLSDFEQTLTPEEREMFVEYKEIFDLLNEVIVQTVKHEVNFDREIISIARIFHRLGLPIAGIIAEEKKHEGNDSLTIVYQLEKIAGLDSTATIDGLRTACERKFKEEGRRFFPTIWGEPVYQGIEWALMVAEWDMKQGTRDEAQEFVLRIPPKGYNTDRFSSAFVGVDYLSEGYQMLARACIHMGDNPLRGIASCDPLQVRSILTTVVRTYIERGDLENAARVCDIQKAWCTNLSEGNAPVTIACGDVTRTWDMADLHDVRHNVQEFFFDQYSLLQSMHAIALAKHEKGINCDEELQQSKELVEEIERQTRPTSSDARYRAEAALAHCASDATRTFIRLGMDQEAESMLPLMLQHKYWFDDNEVSPLAMAYAALGDITEAKKYVSGTDPHAVRIVAEHAFLCGQEEAGNYFAALLANICTTSRSKQKKAVFNSDAVKNLKEYSRLRMFLGRRKSKKYTFPVLDYEWMLEYDLNNERQTDKAETCALEHIEGVLGDIGVWHESLSQYQKAKVLSGACVALQETQKDLVNRAFGGSVRELGRREKCCLLSRFMSTLPDPEYVQQAYARSLNVLTENGIANMRDIQEMTGVPFDKERHAPDVEGWYEHLFGNIVKVDYFADPTYNLDRAKALSDFTGIPVSVELISETFKKMLDGRHKGGVVWQLLDHFKDIPLLWDVIDPQADSEIYEATRKMPSNDLQKKVWDVLCERGGLISRDLGAQSREQYPHIPPPVYAVWTEMNDPVAYLWSDRYLKALDNAYATIRANIAKKRSGWRTVLDRLDYGIIVSRHSGMDMGSFLFVLNGFMERGISPEQLSALFYSFALVAQLYQSIEKINLGIALDADIALRKLHSFSGSPEEYVQQLERQASDLFGELIGVSGISYEQIMRVKEQWGSFDVAFTLAAKYAKGYEDGLPLFRSILLAVFQDRWHPFRYDETDPIIAGQFEASTPEEKQGWIEKSPAEKLSTIALEAIETKDILREVQKNLSTQHIYPLEYRSSEKHLFEKIIYLASLELRSYNVIALKDAARSLLYENSRLPDILKKIGVTSKPDDDEFEHECSAALEREIADLSSRDTLTRQQKTALGHYRVTRDWLAARKGHEQGYADLRDIGITDPTNLDVLEEAVKALETTEVFARLCQLSQGDIKNSVLPPYMIDIDGGGGRSDSLSDAIEKLIKVFEARQSPFVQNLKNIQTLLEKRFDIGLLEHLDLTIRESDDMKECLESGKYPIGAQSCQNYESEVHYNKCLLATAGDADKKQIIIEKADGTILAEAQIKLVYVSNEVPAIFIEPTYSALEDRYDVNPLINRYAQAKARRMSERVKVLRGADEGEQGAVLVTVRPSRNHYQYEDGKRGGVAHTGLGVKEDEYAMWAVEVG